MKTWHIIAGLAAVGLFWSSTNGGDVTGSAARLQDSSRAQVAKEDEKRLERRRLREQERLSKVALDRYRTGCIRVIHTETQTADTRFIDGDNVIDASGAGRQLRDGTAICNAVGDTAISINGQAQRTASVALDDMSELSSIFQRIEEQQEALTQ